MALVPLAKRQMSPSELRHRQRLQAGISATTATMGLTALGTRFGGKALPKAGRLVRASEPVVARLERASAGSEKHATGLLTVGAGLSGLGGYNQSAIYRTEGHRRVAKSARAYEEVLELIEEGHDPVVVEKAFRAFDPESRRQRRLKVEQGTLAAGSVGSAGMALRPNRSVEFRDAKAARNATRAKALKDFHEAHALFESRVGDKGARRGQTAEHAYRKMRSAAGFFDSTTGHAMRMKAAKVPAASRGKWGAAAVGLGAASAGVAAYRRSGANQSYSGWNRGSGA